MMACMIGWIEWKSSFVCRSVRSWLLFLVRVLFASSSWTFCLRSLIPLLHLISSHLNFGHKTHYQGTETIIVRSYCCIFKMS